MGSELATPTLGLFGNGQIKAMCFIHFCFYVHKNRVESHSNSLNKTEKET